MRQMRLTLTGTGPAEGFPVTGCSCAVCSRARREGLVAQPAMLVSPGQWSIDVHGRLSDLTPDTAASGTAVSCSAPPSPSPASPPAAEAEVGIGGTRFEALGEGVMLVRAAGGEVLVWAPGCGDLQDATLELLAGKLTAGPALAVFLGPAADPGPLGSGEMPSVGCARTLSRLRARNLIDPGTRCLLVGIGHGETHRGRLEACLPFWGAELPVDGTEIELPPNSPAPPRPWQGRMLVLGGSGSGKSAFAEQMVSAAPEVVYLATGPRPDAGPDTGRDAGPATDANGDELPTEHPSDQEWAARVKKHQARRPEWWGTLETIDVAEPLATDGRAILLDSVGTWLSGVLDRCGAWEDRPGWRDELAIETEALLAAWRDRAAPLVAVSDEVGWSIVPATESGRMFRDELGRLNARLADQSEDVFVVVAGRLLTTQA